MGAAVELPNLPALVAVLFSAVPGMIILYVLLNRYDTFFSERRVLMGLGVGLTAGAVVTLVQILFLGFHTVAFLLGTVWYLGLAQLVIMYPIIEAMGKLITVNWHSYRGKRDTPYYAAAIGVGFAMINSFILVARGVASYAQVLGQLTHFQIATAGLVMFLMFVGGIMTHAFSVVVMGQGVADRDPIRAFFYGALFVMPYYVGYWGFTHSVGSPVLALLVALAVFTYGALGIAYVRRNILEKVVPPKVARKLRREMRRQALEGKEEPMQEPPRE